MCIRDAPVREREMCFPSQTTSCVGSRQLLGEMIRVNDLKYSVKRVVIQAQVTGEVESISTSS
jgi:hypothetical protein